MKDFLGECYAFFAAGHDALDVVAGFLLYLIASDPRVQQKAREEADSLMENAKDGMPSFEDIDGKTQYITQVFKEAMRMFPAANVLARQVSETHRFNDILFPKGTEAIGNAYSYHRLGFEDGDEFKPERFNSGSKEAEQLHLGFGYGLRMCFGRRLANVLVRSMIVHLLHRYEIRTDPLRPCVAEFHFGLRPSSNQTFLFISHRSKNKI